MSKFLTDFSLIMLLRLNYFTESILKHNNKKENSNDHRAIAYGQQQVLFLLHSVHEQSLIIIKMLKYQNCFNLFPNQIQGRIYTFLYYFYQISDKITYIAFQIMLNLQQYNQIAMNHTSSLNFYYDYYPYFMPPPISYPISPSYPFDSNQKSPPSQEAKIKEETNPNLKIQELQSNYIQPKQQPAQPIILPSKKVRSQLKKTQTDSFTQKRNIIPNNINHILAFLQRKSKSQRYVKMLINKNGGMASYTAKKFFCYQQHLKDKLHVHVNKQSLTMLINHIDQCSQIFGIEEQKFYNRITRILIYYYLRAIAKITILSSGRVKQTNKKDHLNAQREILSHIMEYGHSS